MLPMAWARLPSAPSGDTSRWDGHVFPEHHRAVTKCEGAPDGPAIALTEEYASLLDGLIAAVGRSAVLTGADADPSLIDWRRLFGGPAIAVVRPATTEEVAEVVRLCAETDVAVVSQGGNTGISGGSVPIEGQPSVVVSLTRMNTIESIDVDRWTACVDAGVTVQALQEAAAAAGRLFAPDWGARGTATIGGAIATDAGGSNVLRYGNMRDQVLGVEVVLPDGRVWDGRRALRKDSSGYDLKHLFIGSEGTLGIVTRAVVALHPATPCQASAMVSLGSLDDLMAFYDHMLGAAPDAITAFELMPEVGVAEVCRAFEIAHPIDQRAEFYVLMKLAAAQSVDDLLTDALADAAEAGLITDAVIAASAAQEERLWTIREELPPPTLFPETHGAGLKGDSAVPIDQITAYYRAVADIAAELVPDAVVYGFGHVGDGNLHMNVLPASGAVVDAFLERKPELLRRVDEATIALGGTLSAEHGVGQDVRRRIGAQKPDIEWELMELVKSAIDPHRRMNPGKVLP